MVSNRAYKSIYAIYRSQTQIVTRIDVAHSLLCFAIAKINKNSGFCKVFAQKKWLLLQLLQLLQLKSQREDPQKRHLLSHCPGSSPCRTVGQCAFLVKDKFNESSI